MPGNEGEHCDRREHGDERAHGNGGDERRWGEHSDRGEQGDGGAHGDAGEPGDGGQHGDGGEHGDGQSGEPSRPGHTCITGTPVPAGELGLEVLARAARGPRSLVHGLCRKLWPRTPRPSYRGYKRTVSLLGHLSYTEHVRLPRPANSNYPFGGGNGDEKVTNPALTCDLDPGLTGDNSSQGEAVSSRPRAALCTGPPLQKAKGEERTL